MIKINIQLAANPADETFIRMECTSELKEEIGLAKTLEAKFTKNLEIPIKMLPAMWMFEKGNDDDKKKAIDALSDLAVEALKKMSPRNIADVLSGNIPDFLKH